MTCYEKINPLWGNRRYDSAMEGSSRRDAAVGRHDSIPSEMETCNLEKQRQGDPIAAKLDVLLDKFDRWESWKEETDRRFEYLEPVIAREIEPPYVNYDADDREYADYRQRRSPSKCQRPRNPNYRGRDSHADGRGIRVVHDGDSRDVNRQWCGRIAQPDYFAHDRRCGSCWDPPGSRLLPEFPASGAPPARQRSCWDPPERNIQEGVLTYKPQRPSDCPPPLPLRSDSTHVLHKPRKIIEKSQQHDIPNNPSLMVRSLSPAQLDAINDYNKKLQAYRLEQAALLARVTAIYDESIDAKNLVEVPNDKSLEEVPYDESLEEIVKPYDESLEEIVEMDNMLPQVLAGAYDQEIGDLIVPTHRELELKDVVENCSSENGGSLLRMFSKDSLCVDLRKFTFDAVFDVKSGDLLYPTQWELEIKDEVGNGSAFARLQRPGTFDPGGDKSPKLLLLTLLVASWFPP